MRDRIKTNVACALLAAVCMLGALGARASAEPDPAVQREIDRVVASIVDVGDGHGTAEVLDRIERLETSVGGDREILLLQLAVYLSTADGTEQAMGAALLLDHLQFSNAEIVQAIAPRIGTDDSSLRRVFGEILATVDRPAAGEPDFDHYLPYLEANPDEPPVPLVEYLYSVSPSRGLSVLAVVYSPTAAARAEIQRAAELVGQALAGERPGSETRVRLDALSRSDLWWVRSFVKRTLEIAPELGSPEIRSRLESDSHPAVGASAGR